MWWLGAVALLVVLWMALVRRDWRAWVALAGYAAVYLPWFAYAHRTIFTFYAIALAPYVALTLVLAIAWLTGLLPPLHGPARRPAEVPAAVDDDGVASLPTGGTGADAPAPAGPVRTGSTAATALAEADDALAGEEAATDDDGGHHAPGTRVGHGVLAVVCLLAVAAFAYFWPVWTGETVPYELWRSRMWLGSWV